MESNQEASSDEEPTMSSKQAIYRVWLEQTGAVLVNHAGGAAETGSTKMLDPGFGCLVGILEVLREMGRGWTCWKGRDGDRFGAHSRLTLLPNRAYLLFPPATPLKLGNSRCLDIKYGRWEGCWVYESYGKRDDG